MKINMPNLYSRCLNSDNHPPRFPFSHDEGQPSTQAPTLPLNIDPFLALALEPRFMFDAAGLATAVAVDDATTTDIQVAAVDTAEAEFNAANEAERMDSLAAALAVPAIQEIEDGDELLIRTTSMEVVFIDASVSSTDTNILLANTPAGAEVVFINGDSDGLTQIANWLQAYDNISAIHIISHGDDGNVQLGNTTINNANLSDYTEQLGIIGDALTTDGDILFYGCNLGETAGGLKFIDQLAFLTDADIAASDDLTGAAELGGDWDLEIATGTIEANQTFTAEAMKGFSSVLGIPGTITFDFDSGSYNGYASDDATYTYVGDYSYTLVIDGQDEPAFVYSSQGLFIGGAKNSNETEVTFSITGYAFDATSIYIRNITTGVNRTFTVTSNVGGDTATTGVLADGAYTTLSLSGFTGITKLYVTPDTGARFNVDNLVVTNLAESGGNSAPTINLGGTTAVTVTEDVQTNIDLSALTFADGDGDNLTVTLTADAGTLASAQGNTTTGGVTITNSGTAAISLAGTAANINTYLDTTTNIKYTTPLNDNTANSIAVKVNDGTDDDATNDNITVNITPVNDAPTTTNLNGDGVSYVKGAAATVLDAGSNATLADVDSTNFDGGTLTVTITSGGDSAEDQLGISTASGVTLSNGLNDGSTITVGGTVIGTIAAVGMDQVDVGEDLVINFNTNATPAKVQTLLRSLTYQNTNNVDPSLGARNVRITVTDGDGGTSANADITVTVSANSEPPAISDLALGANVSANSFDLTFKVSDVDSALTDVTIKVFQESIQIDAANITFDQETGEVIVKNIRVLSSTLQINVTDGTNTTVATLQIVENNNDEGGTGHESTSLDSTEFSGEKSVQTLTTEAAQQLNTDLTAKNADAAINTEGKVNKVNLGKLTFDTTTTGALNMADVVTIIGVGSSVLWSRWSKRLAQVSGIGKVIGGR